MNLDGTDRRGRETRGAKDWTGLENGGVIKYSVLKARAETI